MIAALFVNIYQLEETVHLNMKNITNVYTENPNKRFTFNEDFSKNV